MSIFENEFPIILLWVGVWGVCESVINIYVDEENYKLRILVYSIIAVIALLLHKNYDQNMIRQIFNEPDENLKKKLNKLI